MVFSSVTFLVYFLPLNLILYFMFKSRKMKNIILIIFSLIFYSWGEPIWVTLLLFSATVDYTISHRIDKTDDKRRKKMFLIMSISINLLLLVIFKYYGFIIETVNSISGLNMQYKEFGLPIGISFYTFQTMSYTIDVYRGEVKAQKSYLKFLMFVSLFHQLVAGPIVRYKDIEHEINHRRENIKDFSLGINRFVIGLFKKAIIANIAGEIAKTIFGLPLDSLSILGSWLGITFFAFQIYFDFSAYSDMAIGLGMMFGFHYKENFNYPYISKTVTEFWRRWHISLGSFFRDYLYIPLGGNRKHIFRNILIVWFLTGLWHGASWNFVLWGLYFGLLILIEKAFLMKVLERLPKVIRHMYLIILVLIGWVFFYFENVSHGISYLTHMFSLNSVPLVDTFSKSIVINNLNFILIAVILSTPIIKNAYNLLEGKVFKNTDHFGFGHVLFNMFCYVYSLMHLVGQSYNPFLYFRF